MVIPQQNTRLSGQSFLKQEQRGTCGIVREDTRKVFDLQA